MAQTVVGVMLDQLPVLARNPFTLTLLDPAVVNDYWDVEHRNPFYMWSSNGLNVGGDTGGHNDMLLDGIPLGVGFARLVYAAHGCRAGSGRAAKQRGCRVLASVVAAR